MIDRWASRYGLIDRARSFGDFHFSSVNKMTRVTLDQARRAGNRLNVNFETGISVHALRDGMNVEMEHADVTHNNLTLYARIALAHLSEFPDYYVALKQMETKLKAKWKGKRKPRIYND